MVDTPSNETKRNQQRGATSTIKGGPLKIVDKFTYPRTSVSSIGTDINMRLARRHGQLLIVHWSYGSQARPIK